MKKELCLLAVLLVGCAQSPIVENPVMDSFTFQGKIINDQMLVQRLDEKMNSLYSVGIQNCENCHTMQVGDVVDIVFDGIIKESYPAQIEASEMILRERAEIVLYADDWLYQDDETITLTFLNNQEEPIYLLSIPFLEVLKENEFVPVDTQITGCGVRDRIEKEYIFPLPLLQVYPDLPSGHYRVSFNVALDEQYDETIDVFAEFDFENNQLCHLPKEETLQMDRIPMVMIDGKLYADTGKQRTSVKEDGLMDGQITTSVDANEIPTQDHQSNFGSGFEYQYGSNDTIDVFIQGKWIVFEQLKENE